ncbi:MAG: hypothetical protein LUF91_02620 [Oscillospiraceae bacterium]|nr:hypothetical protein [Oscillospiraceae bacterium]
MGTATVLKFLSGQQHLFLRRRRNRQERPAFPVQNPQGTYTHRALIPAGHSAGKGTGGFVPAGAGEFRRWEPGFTSEEATSFPYARKGSKGATGGGVRIPSPPPEQQPLNRNGLRAVSFYFQRFTPFLLSRFAHSNEQKRTEKFQNFAHGIALEFPIGFSCQDPDASCVRVFFVVQKYYLIIRQNKRDTPANKFGNSYQVFCRPTAAPHFIDHTLWRDSKKRGKLSLLVTAQRNDGFDFV